MNCQDCQFALTALLLEETTPPTAAVRVHLEACSACREEFASLQATFALLEEWQAPEPSAYFDQRLAVRLREEQAIAPAGWYERLQSRLLFNTGRQFRPALAGAFALVLLVGGGTFAKIANYSHPSFSHSSKEVSATVTDLQILDKNDQALLTMDQLLQEDGAVDDGSSNTSPSI